MKPDIKLSVYQSINPSSFEGNLTIQAIVEAIKSDDYKKQTDNLRSMIMRLGKLPLESSAKKNEKHLVRQFKEKNFWTVAWSGEFGKELIGNKGLKMHSGLICIDVDDLPSDRLPTLVEELKADTYTYILFVSPSGTGIKIVVRTECSTIDEHKLYFKQLTDYYAECYKLTTRRTVPINKKPNLDPACSNVNRLCYLPWDPTVFYNPESKIVPLLDEYRTKPEQTLTHIISQDATRTGFEDNTLKRIEICIRRLNENSIDLTSNYDDWIKIGLAFASMGELGRTYFHEVSRNYPKYNFAETEAKFTELLRKNNGKVNIGTFFNHVEQVLGKVWLESNSSDQQDTNSSSANPQPSISHEWPTPKPIKTPLLPVLSVKSDMLPEPLRPWLIDIANRMGCPLDFVTATAVVMLSSLIGTRLAIRPKQRDDWTVIPNLWGAVIGDPSRKKTPASSEVLRPLNRLIAESQRQFEQETIRYEKELATYEAQKKVYQSQELERLKGKPINREVSYPQPPTKPTQLRYMTNDATIEKLGELLNQNPAGLLQFRDEIIGLLAGWERAGREQDRAFYLEAWNGSNSMAIDRIGRGTFYVKNVCVSLFGGIQPSKLMSYLPGVSGSDNDGFIQRLQVIVYPDDVNCAYTDERPDKKAQDDAFALIKLLAESNFSTIGYDGDEHNRFRYTRFDEEAQEVFKNWIIRLETKVRNQESGLLQEHFAKYGSLMPSLALIFHVVNCLGSSKVTSESQKQLVSVDAAQMAIRWCEYLMSHARRIYGLVDTANINSAKELLRHIKQGDIKDGFKIRDVYRKQWTYLKTKEQVETALMELIDRDYLKEVQSSTPTGGRPEAPQYLINPKTISNT